MFDWLMKMLKRKQKSKDELFTKFYYTACIICDRLENSTSQQAKASLARHQAGSKCTREVVNG